MFCLAISKCPICNETIIETLLRACYNAFGNGVSKFDDGIYKLFETRSVAIFSFPARIVLSVRRA